MSVSRSLVPCPATRLRTRLRRVGSQSAVASAKAESGASVITAFKGIESAVTTGSSAFADDDAELSLSAQRTFRRRNLVCRAWIDCGRDPERARQTLEAGFGNMMIVGAVKRGHMQRDAGVHGERLKPLLHQLGIEGADLVAHELGLEHQERPA